MASLLLAILLVLLSSPATTPATRLADIRKTRLRFYFHNTIHGGGDATAIPVVLGTSKFFGSIAVLDDPLTEGPSKTSKLIGRAQGVSVYSSRSTAEPATLMNVNFVFTAGKHNGSTLVVLGRNAIRSGKRELPVIGGTGKFRLARGYAKLKTYSQNLTAGFATVEYSVHVFHH